MRIKYYRNDVHAHIQTTEVSDADFDIYWSELSGVLQKLSLGLGVDISGDIAYLKTCNLDDGRWTEVLMHEIKNNRRYSECIVGIAVLAIFLVTALFLPSYFKKEPDYFYA